MTTHIDPKSYAPSPIRSSAPTKAAIRQRKRIGDFERNTNISLLNKYVYFAVDKAANSTIKQCLFEIEYSPIGATPLTLFDKRCSPLLSPYQLPSDLKQQALMSDEFFRFAFVRNPYSRLLSCYLDRILRQTSRPRRELNIELKKRGTSTAEVTFEAFVQITCNQRSPAQNSHWRRQYDDLCCDLVELHYIGRFETLWSDMARVSERIFGKLMPEMCDRGINKAPTQTSADQQVRQYYTQELADLVFESYEQDFKSFGYDRMIL